MACEDNGTSFVFINMKFKDQLNNITGCFFLNQLKIMLFL